MALRDFLDYVATHSQETITWELGGRVGTYEGKMIIVEKKSTNPPIGTYKDFHIITSSMSHPIVCSADEESPFSRTHTIRDRKIISLEAA